MKALIVYASTAGATETVAQHLAAELGGQAIFAGAATPVALAACDLLVLGASTTGMGDLQHDMADFLLALNHIDLSAKLGAAFSLGDQVGHTRSYVDGLADMAAALDAKGLQRVGVWPAADYHFSASRAIEGGRFMGLALDEENESDKTPERVAAWARQLKQEMGA